MELHRVTSVVSREEKLPEKHRVDFSSCLRADHTNNTHQFSKLLGYVPPLLKVKVENQDVQQAAARL